MNATATKTATTTTTEHLSLREATIKLLGTRKGRLGMTAREIIETLATRGWWTPATGKTPVPTLLCLLHTNKGRNGTFRRSKSDRGVTWTLRAAK